MVATEEQVIALIRRECGWLAKDQAITMDTTMEELNLDSLDEVELQMAAEDTFHVEMSDLHWPYKNVRRFYEVINKINV
jgi:acyl carrier protein